MPVDASGPVAVAPPDTDVAEESAEGAVPEDVRTPGPR
jgi:hypothetical protein